MQGHEIVESNSNSSSSSTLSGAGSHAERRPNDLPLASTSSSSKSHRRRHHSNVPRSQSYSGRSGQTQFLKSDEIGFIFLFLTQVIFKNWNVQVYKSRWTEPRRRPIREPTPKGLVIGTARSTISTWSASAQRAQVQVVRKRTTTRIICHLGELTEVFVFLTCPTTPWHWLRLAIEQPPFSLSLELKRRKIKTVLYHNRLNINHQSRVFYLHEFWLCCCLATESSGFVRPLSSANCMNWMNCMNCMVKMPYNHLFNNLEWYSLEDSINLKL